MSTTSSVSLGADGLSGAIALVTGASRGIGLATCRLLHSKDCTVIGVSRNLSDLQEHMIRDNSSSDDARCLDYCIAADLSTKEGCQKVVNETITKYGTIHILIVNHGIGSAAEVSMESSSMDTFEQTIATNLMGPYYLTRLVIPHMVQQRYGRCIYTSSTAGLDAEPNAVAYNTSKAGLQGLMKSVWVDCGKYNITSNAVCPGWVQTEMAELYAQQEAKDRGKTVEQVWKERAALYPPNRVVTTDEVAHTIVFLASRNSSGISGECIRVALGSVI